MLKRARQTLVLFAMCVLLSLIFPTAAALACPGGGGGGEGEPGTAFLTPSSKTFAAVNDTQTFNFLYYREPTNDPGARRVSLRIVPGEHFQISEYGTCQDRGILVSLSPGQSCSFVVRAIRAGGSATLTGELANGVSARSALRS